MKFFKKRKALTIVIILVVVALGAYFIFKKPKTTTSTATVQRGDVVQTLTLSGELDSHQKADLAFQSSGLLTSVAVKQGQKVYQGQYLASLDTRAQKLNLQKSLNLYSITRLDFDQTNQDNKDYLENPDSLYRDTVKRSLDKTQYTLDNSVIDVQSQDLSIKLASITSPIGGVVTAISNPITGVNVAAYQPQITIVNPSTVYLSVSADQTDIPNIKVGQQADIVFDAYPDQTVTGTISNIAFVPTAGEVGTVYAVEIDLTAYDNADLKYKIGMTADADFVVEQKKDVLYVEPQYIKEDANGKQYLLVGENKKIVYVQTGVEGDGRVEVTGDIQQGDIISL